MDFDLSNTIINLTKMIGRNYIRDPPTFGITNPVIGFDFQAGSSLVNDIVVGDPTIKSSQNNVSNNIKIYCSGDIYSSGSYINASDKRIKYDIESYNPLKALEKINLLRVTTYKKIDDINDNTQIGFIAQEVNEIIPESITKIKMYIPNIFQWVNCEINKDQIIIENIFNLRFQDRIQLMDENQNKFSSIVIDTEDNKAIFLLDDINIKPNIKNKVLVYGKKIEDFHSIDKDMIFSLAVASIQELSTKINILQQEIKEMKEKEKEKKPRKVKTK